MEKVWNQPKCPTTDEQVKKMWSIYTMVYYSAIEKVETTLLSSTCTDLEITVLSEANHIEKYKYCMRYVNLNMTKMNLSMKQ